VYRRTRVEAEAIALEHATDTLSVSIARPKTFIGPGRLGAFALMFDMVHEGGAVPLLGAGTHRYQLLDVRDLATALCTLAEEGGDGVYHFGTTEFGNVGDELRELLEHAGTGARVVHVPARVARLALRSLELSGASPASEWQLCAARGEDSVVSVERAQRELGWEPAYGNVGALIDAYDWYASQRDANAGGLTTHPVPASHRLVRRLTGWLPG
jgi:nucleoside-diphosphate-sugar epimerase